MHALAATRPALASAGSARPRARSAAAAVPAVRAAAPLAPRRRRAAAVRPLASTDGGEGAMDDPYKVRSRGGRVRTPCCVDVRVGAGSCPGRSVLESAIGWRLWSPPPLSASHTTPPPWTLGWAAHTPPTAPAGRSVAMHMQRGG
jgi:hypothetical protein